MERDLEEEKKEIVKRYRQLLKVSKWSREKGDVKMIRDAFDLSMDAHRDMRRKSGEPYIYHPLAVARIAAEEIGLGTTSIVCALLHDVVEDSHVELSDIERQFGPKVARIIDGLTKISGVFDHETTSPQAENFRKMLLTLSEDVRVILIKLCDRLHNMRTLDHMSAKGQLKIASETQYLYAPLAHRLGLYAIKTELEDLSLKYTDPAEYNFIKQKLASTKEQRNRYIRKFIAPLKTELDKLSLNFDVKGRPKSIFSILNKIKTQHVPFEEVYDLFAIRITIDSVPEREKIDCWNVYSIVTNIYYPNPDRLRDWVSTPKSNGYESLHTTVMGPMGKWVEVQIRTRRMDEIAEKGYAAHWKYKESTAEANNLDLWLMKIREVIENPQENALDFLDDFKLSLYSEEVFVFTPKGELRKLPLKSTILDFAFDIHSEVGASCIGAKVNNKLVPISHVLQNGDQVEIITSSKQKPNRGWLDFVITAKAKGKIKQLLKEEKRLKAEEGREILSRKFRNSKIEMSKENLRNLCTVLKIPSESDLFYLLASGGLNKETLQLKELLGSYKGPKEHLKGKGEKKSTKPKEDAIVLGETDTQLDYSFAKCCSPIPGDEVVGFITIGDGIKIHRTNCKNAQSLMSNYGYRIIKARWASQPIIDDYPFEAGIEISGIDSIGLVSGITDIVSKQLNLNMKSISFSSLNGTFTGHMVLFITSTAHLEALMDKVKEIDKFINVRRVDVPHDESFLKE
jgi:guanosine-3',5'-bis(diphosphate) 3'-pyrophosphohydrolase